MARGSNPRSPVSVRSTRFPCPVAGAALVALVLIGCGEIDEQKAEGLVRDVWAEVRKRDRDAPDLTEVDCPVGVQIEPGETFDCDLEFEDRSKGVAKVKMTDDEGKIELTGRDFKRKR